MPTKPEFYSRPPAQVSVDIEYPEVIRLDDDGEPVLRFPPESSASLKRYRRLRSYDDPRVGDRVQIIDGIIQGALAR